MAERITKEQLWERARNVNRRLNPDRSPIEYTVDGRYVYVERRNGSVALDEYQGRTCIRTITVGTAREIYDFLHAMMVGIDLSRVEAERLTPTADSLGIDTSKDGWLAEYSRRVKGS